MPNTIRDTSRDSESRYSAREETALRETERRLLVAQSAARIGSWEFDILTGAISWSPETFRLLDFDPAQGEPDFETMQQRYHPDDRAAHAATVERAIRNAAPFEINLRAVLNDGTVRWLRSMGDISQTADGKVTRLSGVVQDITERKEIHDALVKSERRYRQIVETANEGIWTTDADGFAVFVNPKMMEMLGYTSEDLLGKPLEFIASENSRIRIQEGRERRSHGVSEQYEIELCHKERGFFWAKVSASPILSPAGNFEGALAMITDISEQKRNEAALQESEARFRSTFDAAAVGMTINSVDGILLEVNDAFCQFVGYAREELIGRHVATLTDSENMQIIQEFRRRCLASEISFYRMEKIYRHKDGRVLWADLTSSLVRDSKTRKPKYFIAQVADITARKRLEQQMIQSAKLASLGELVAGVAHEINNPLAAISGQAQLLEYSPDSQVREDARMIRAMAERASRIVQALRSYAQPSEISAVARQKRGDLNRVVRSALAVMTYSLRDADINLETDLADDLFFVPMNSGEIEQVLVNLLSNAVYVLKRLPEEERTLRIRTWNTGFGGDHHGPDTAALSVTDTGPGIPETVAARIFDPFFTTKDTDEGTGLGLYISHSILTAHAGTISVESQEGIGTTFTLSLPVG